MDRKQSNFALKHEVQPTRSAARAGRGADRTMTVVFPPHPAPTQKGIRQTILGKTLQLAFQQYR